MSKGKRELDDRLPTTMISKHQLADVREAAYQSRMSLGRFVRNALDEKLEKLKRAA